MTVLLVINPPSNKPITGEEGKGGKSGKYDKEGKALIELKEIAYQVGLEPGVTAYVTRPRVDKISMTYHVEDQELRKAIEHSLIQYVSPLSGHSFINFKDNKGGVKYAVNVKYVAPGTEESVLIQAGPKTANKNANPAFLRFEFNPYKFGFDNLSVFKKVLAEFCYQEVTYSSLLQQARVTRVDVACEFINVPTAQVFCRYHKPAKWHVYFSSDGVAETIYMGMTAKQKWANAKIYNKLQEQVDKELPLDFQGLDHMRVEVRSAKKPMLKDLGSLNNPFGAVELFFPRLTMPPKKTETHFWSMFMDSCRMRGIEGALDLLPSEIRKDFAKHLEESKVAIWKPDQVWAKWDQALEDSGLLTP